MRDSVKEGYGIQVWPDGHKYLGYWKDNKYHDKGRLRYPDGEKYEGFWKEGIRHGVGMYTSVDFTQFYEGEWNEGT